MAESRQSIIDEFENIVHQLITEAARYVAEGPGPGGTEAEAQANIRRLRTLSAALNAAVMSVQTMPPRLAQPS